MGNNFSKIKDGEFFTTTDGERYKKTGPLTFDSLVGIEQYIDPLFDKKIGQPTSAAQSGIDTSARVVKSEPESAPTKKAAKKKDKKTKQ
jgi:hypothetical protein